MRTTFFAVLAAVGVASAQVGQITDGQPQAPTGAPMGPGAPNMPYNGTWTSKGAASGTGVMTKSVAPTGGVSVSPTTTGPSVTGTNAAAPVGAGAGLAGAALAGVLAFLV